MDLFVKKYYPLILSFFGPFVILIAYFSARQMTPFGSNSLLTVDLGQQYVDFFAYFKNTLLHNFSGIFYSFSKAIGGEMIGEWAYYLFSPFNLILLLFPTKNLLTAIMMLTLFKVAFSGLSFALLLTSRKIQSGIMIPLFSTAYALSGWVVANLLNILWLDATVFLPLIILGFYLLLDRKNYFYYPLFLALLLISNYYMGYMVCIFLILFYFYYAISEFKNSKNFIKDSILFSTYSLLAGGLASIVLMPTFFALQNSKAQYMQHLFNLKIEYNPLKLLTKLTLGSFDFKQMPSGFANIFCSSLALVLFVMFFLNNRFSLKERIAAFVVSSFLFTSLFFEPFDLLWHGFQFPVWYPYRFSFIVSFWVIFLAAKTFNPKLAPKPWLIWLSFLFLSFIIGYSFIMLKKISYLNERVILFSSLAYMLTLLLLSLHSSKINSLRNIFLYILVFFEMATNLSFSLNNLSYLSKTDYTYPTEALTKDITLLKNFDNSFYRVGQIYTRTKNDGIAHNFNSGSYFSSALEKSIPDFYGQIGNPDGDNYVSYSNGTLISDSLLDMRYFLVPKDVAELKNQAGTLNVTSERNDLKQYQLLFENNLSRIYRNPFSTSIAYSSSQKIKKLPILYDDPLNYQTNWINALTNTWPTTKYFTAQNFNEVVFQNTNKVVNLTGAKIFKQNKKKTAQLIFKFTPKTNNAYYLTLGSALNDDNASISLGNRKLNYVSSFRHTDVINIANQQKDEEIILTIRLKKRQLNLNNFVLYMLDNKLIEEKLASIKKQSLTVNHYTSNKIQGSINIKRKNQVLTTTIPYSQGWHIKVDNKYVNPYKVQNTFLACDISKGEHTVTFYYRPPYLILGSIVSIISLISLVILAKTKRFSA